MRVIVVTGAGRAFCAGADLSAGADTFDATKRTDRPERNAGPADQVDWADERTRDGGGRVTLQIFESLKPVIGAINGPAVGIGATMQLPMDIRIASETARFGFVFSRRGIVPEAASSFFLPRIVGIAQALAWCFSGKVFDAAEALKGGLVSEGRAAGKAPAPRPRNRARDRRQHRAGFCRADPSDDVARPGHGSPDGGHKVDSKGIYVRGASADVKEGVLSFLEKRPPHFPQKVSSGMPAYFPWWKPRSYS